MATPPILKVRVLGSGTSTGVPTITCRCCVCTSQEPKNKRTRASILITKIETGESILIDTSPDFRAQAIAADLRYLENVLYTHTHADHCHGFDDLRAFYFLSKKAVNCYLSEDFHEEFKSRFAYAFTDTGYQGTAPQISLRNIPESGLSIHGLEIDPIRLPHGSMTTTGFRIGNFAYVTDFKTFPKQHIDRWRGHIDTMIASGLRFRDHPTHSSVQETIEIFSSLKVRQGILSHLSHEVDWTRDQDRLPDHVSFAYDGLEFEV